MSEFDAHRWPRGIYEWDGGEFPEGTKCKGCGRKIFAFQGSVVTAPRGVLRELRHEAEGVGHDEIGLPWYCCDLMCVKMAIEETLDLGYGGPV